MRVRRVSVKGVEAINAALRDVQNIFVGQPVQIPFITGVKMRLLRRASAHHIEIVAVFDIRAAAGHRAVDRAPEIGVHQAVGVSELVRRHLKREIAVYQRAFVGDWRNARKRKHAEYS